MGTVYNLNGGDNVQLFARFTPNNKNGIYYLAPVSPYQGVEQWYVDKARAAAPVVYELGIKNLRPTAQKYVDIPYTDFVYPGATGLESKVIDPRQITYCIIKLPGDYGRYKYARPDYPDQYTQTATRYYFYFVKNFEILNDMVRFYLSVDLWAEFINTAAISNIRLLRSNFEPRDDYLNEHALFTVDDVQKPYAYDLKTQEVEFYRLKRNSQSIRNLKFYLVIRYQQKKAFSNTLERVGIFVLNPWTIFDNTSEESDYYNVPDRLVFTLGYNLAQNIYQTGTALDSGDAEVLHIYLFGHNLDTSVLAEAPTGQIAFKSIDEKRESKEIELPLYEGGGVTRIDWSIRRGQLSALDSDEPNITDIPMSNSPVYFGTRDNALLLPNFVGIMKVGLSVYASDDKMTFKLTACDQSRDITEAYELPINANTSTETSLEKVSKWLGIIGGVASSAFQIAAGGAGLVTGAVSLASQIPNLYSKGNGKYIPGGNGFITFDDIINDRLPITTASELGLLTYTDEKAETLEINNRGAACDIYIDYPRDSMNAREITQDRLIYLVDPRDASFLTGDDPKPDIVYIKVDDGVAVDNVPSDAADYIAEQLKYGVRVLR